MNYLIIIDALRFAILCGLVNMSQNFLGAFKKLYSLERFDPPIDGSLRFFGERLVGKSATWGGLVVSLFVGIILQIFYSPVGVIIGVGCSFGHIIGSFIKRRLHIRDGDYLPVVDHGNYVIFTGAILLCLGDISVPVYFLSIVIILLVNPLFCLSGYALGIRDRKL